MKSIAQTQKNNEKIQRPIYLWSIETMLCVFHCSNSIASGISYFNAMGHFIDKYTISTQIPVWKLRNKLDFKWYTRHAHNAWNSTNPEPLVWMVVKWTNVWAFVQLTVIRTKSLVLLIRQASCVCVCASGREYLFHCYPIQLCMRICLSHAFLRKKAGMVSTPANSKISSVWMDFRRKYTRKWRI